MTRQGTRRLRQDCAGCVRRGAHTCGRRSRQRAPDVAVPGCLACNGQHRAHTCTQEERAAAVAAARRQDAVAAARAVQPPAQAARRPAVDCRAAVRAAAAANEVAALRRERDEWRTLAFQQLQTITEIMQERSYWHTMYGDMAAFYYRLQSTYDELKIQYDRAVQAIRSASA